MGRSRQAGRATRKRRHKQDSLTQSAALCHQPQYVRLMKFLHGRGFTSRLLQPAHFTGTAPATQPVHLLCQDKTAFLLMREICVCLLGLVIQTLVEDCRLSRLLSWKPRLSPLVALCIFLVCERHQGEASDWFPYIDVLPSTYTCPAYFKDEIMAVLPASVQIKALKQREAVQEIHSANQDFIRTLQPLFSEPVEEVLTYEALRWAWCSVNTRSVFMSHQANSFLCGQDVYALAPFLDLLNHRPDVQVKASFNNVTRCYEITSVAGIKRYHQAFINYGSHDNQRLMLEYGFMAPCNPHSVVYVDSALLIEVLRGDRSLEQKMKFLRENRFLHNLTVSSEGPSWRLMTALRLLSLPQTLYHHWKAVLLGQAVCDELEQWSLLTASTLCQRLLKDTHTALDKITHLLQHCDQTVREQLVVAQSLREEEKCILGSCLMELQSIQVTS